ncbi:MAG: methyltransferase domain-containing protein [Acidobacteria bacterium]|nr:methyltransferase domain-containing protein [Acidobacteriota bacterium]
MNVEAVGNFYNRFAGVYDLVFDQVFREGRREAVEAMGLRPGHRVLEVGVGTGLTLRLYPPGVEVVGIDLSEPMLREALRRLARDRRRRIGVSLLRMDASHLAFADGSFDCVYAPYVVSVVPYPRRVVSEMARVCRPGGRVVVVNHFRSRHPVGRWMETRLSPLTHRVGFRLDLPVESILGIPGLDVVHQRKVNMLRLWQLLVFDKADGEGGWSAARPAFAAARPAVSARAAWPEPARAGSAARTPRRSR